MRHSFVVSFHLLPGGNLSLGQDFETLIGIVDFIMPFSYYTGLMGPRGGVLPPSNGGVVKGSLNPGGLASYRLITG
ncbi:MAG: hypothetical protein FGF53_03185 [Candidatus Brockarchaeota archaeon]|nr:hypothetical protein [Candidatus Brockarchaeota archaeon]MBO3808559.1 hypothetical protein [Candidatus Brockarchaeota archaeon]